MKEQVLEIIKLNHTESTKYIASKLDISTKKAYQLCCELLKEGRICKYGYWVGRGGWEDSENSTHHFNSLYWEIIL